MQICSYKAVLQCMIKQINSILHTSYEPELNKMHIASYQKKHFVNIYYKVLCI